MAVIQDRRICVAPMMDWTDRHCRYFHRLLNPAALLYTEMIHANAVLAGDRTRLLGFDSVEQPLAVQLGGNDPAMLADAARICVDYGYSEINLNVGCPSDRVQTGQFGACLMAQPALVAQCVVAMKNAVSVPVTVKTRIGIDDFDSYEFLLGFVAPVVDAGVDALVVHARIALLAGLSPKQNRSVPPLNYSRVEKLVEHFDTTPIILNGGINELEQIAPMLSLYSGVMLGRAAYHNPWLLAEIGQQLNDTSMTLDRHTVARQFIKYVQRQMVSGVALQSMTRHILGLFQGQPGARHWRRHLSENCHKRGATVAVLEDALEILDHHQVITYK